MKGSGTLAKDTEATDLTQHRTESMLADGFIESFERRYPRSILETLLADRTTAKNIIWADGEYEALGPGYAAEDEMTYEAIAGTNSGVIKPRVLKAQEQQSKRTKARAEVFSPSWLVNEMANVLDEDWFRRRGAFTEERGETWEPNSEKVEFPSAKGRGWHDYVRSTRLEITCGEAPFLCSRYDAVTGEALPVARRVGVLDRKLRVVGERSQTYKSWARWALAALKATYGYEYQGDNLLIARVNCLETFVEHCIDRWGVSPRHEDVRDATWVISWNLWQMNGLTCAVPTTRLDAPIQSTLGGYVAPEQEPQQPTLFDFLDELNGEGGESGTTEGKGTDTPADGTPLCVIYDWENDQPVEFSSMKGEVSKGMKKFYAVIGNPPYQEEFTDEGNKTYAAPIYNSFMDAAELVADRVELITPARFLFDAGSTPKAWNKKKLEDPHFKVLHYEEDASKVFAGTDIKGGVAVTLEDQARDFGAIEVFTKDPELTSILRKVIHSASFRGLDTDMYIQNCFNSDTLYRDYPQYKSVIGSQGKDRRFETSIFEKIPLFVDAPSHDDDIKVLGVRNGQRIWKYFPRIYMDISHANLDHYKAIVAKSSGSGVFGERLSTPLVEAPGEAFTRTFISVGAFESRDQAENAVSYIKSKFLRTMLGVLKTTQHNPVTTWRYVPLQDFTSFSDIDWSQSVADIDQQLYRKYGLSQDEVDFIESHVKEME